MVVVCIVAAVVFFYCFLFVRRPFYFIHSPAVLTLDVTLYIRIVDPLLFTYHSDPGLFISDCCTSDFATLLSDRSAEDLIKNVSKLPQILCSVGAAVFEYQFFFFFFFFFFCIYAWFPASSDHRFFFFFFLCNRPQAVSEKLSEAGVTVHSVLVQRLSVPDGIRKAYERRVATRGACGSDR
jgi:hypothetical protein